MFKTVAEVVIAVVLAGLLLHLLRQRRRLQPRHRGFDLLLTGLALVTFAAVLDTSELQILFEGEARQAVLFLELIGGYLAGIVLLGIGLSLWVPALASSQEQVRARLEAEASLRRSTADLRARNEALELLYDLAERLHRPVRIEEIGRAAIDALLTLSQPPLVAFYLLSEEGTRLELVASHGFEGDVRAIGASLPVHGSLSGVAIAERRLVHCADISGDRRLEPALQEALVDRGVHAAVVIPIVLQDRALGTVNLIYTEPRAFDEPFLDTLRAIGTTVAFAVANARLVARLEHHAYHDSLTGLPNRDQLHLDSGTGSGTFRDGDRCALLVCDLDRFKEVNDALGHGVGDRLLQSIAGRLRSLMDDRNGRVYRLGGDEFAMLLPGADTSVAQRVGREALIAIRRPVKVEGMLLEVAASVGIAGCPEHGTDSSQLLRCADIAMYNAKQTADSIAVYSPETDRNTPERLALLWDLGRAIRNGELELCYQPKCELATGVLVGFEALVRWRHARLGVLPPAEFLPLAEFGEVIQALTGWVVDEALSQLRKWRDRGWPVTMAVNLSPRNLLDRNCANALVGLMRRHGVDPADIEFELTETALLSDPEASLDALRRITATGARLAIDDFGTGYSSLSVLRRFPIHALKIDRSFVRGLLSDEPSRTIVRAVVAMARDLELRIVAEGIEDEATRATLQGLGCELGQGFLFARPAPADEVETALEAGRWSLSSA